MKYNVTFLPIGKTVQVDPAGFPLGRHGQPGSLLDIALANDIHIEHACGGVGICGTCHVIVNSGMDKLSAADDSELDVVDQVPGSTLQSRLACQAVVAGDVTVTIPVWNRNAVNEQPAG
jgi:2Fe-2S ferredoxin